MAISPSAWSCQEQPGSRRTHRGSIMKLVFLVLGSALIAVTILSRVRSTKWWIRYADFPRMQIAFGLAVLLAVYLPIYGISGGLDAAFTLAVAGALLYQSVRIFPYTPLASKEVMKASSGNRVVPLLVV